MSRLRQWILLLACLGFAAGVGYALLTVGPVPERSASAVRRSPAKPARAPAAAPARDDQAEPRDHIGDASRAALREVLRDADADAEGG